MRPSDTELAAGKTDLPRGDGGPAFPHGDVRGVPAESFGMSLRDWFAGQALAGLIHRGFTEFGNAQSMYAALAYEYADAMLKARSQEPA